MLRHLHILLITALTLALFACDNPSEVSPQANTQSNEPSSGNQSFRIYPIADQSKRIAFLEETLQVNTSHPNTYKTFSVSVSPSGKVNANIDDSGLLTLSGVDSYIGTATITIQGKANTATDSTSFKLSMQPYAYKGQFDLNQTWQQTISNQIVNRTYDVYRPNTLKTGLPMVIFLHGAFGNKDKSHGLYSPSTGVVMEYPAVRWMELADRDEFVVVYANGLGVSDSNNQTEQLFWNDCRSDIIRQKDDVLFIKNIISEVSNSSSQASLIDTKRVYLTGVSNGGMMTYRMAREHPNLWAAVAPIVANEPEYGTVSITSDDGSQSADVHVGENCVTPNTQEAPPMIALFSKDDQIMPYNGGIPLPTGNFTNLNITQKLGYFGWVKSSTATVSTWQNILGTSTNPSEVHRYPDLSPNDHSTAIKERYINPQSGKELVVITVDGDNHTLPSRRYIVPQNTRAQNTDFEAIDEIWAFFKQHERP